MDILLTENPNAPNIYGRTPIHEAARWSHISFSNSWKYREIVKILAPLTDHPNAPDNDGNTPSSVTKNAEIREFLESFNTTGKLKTHCWTI